MRVVDYSFLDDLLDPESSVAASAASAGVRPPRYHVVLLNYTLFDTPRLSRLLSSATTLYCADGGANRLCERISDFSQSPKVRKVVGDFDSLTAETRSRLKQENFEFVNIGDQYSTDSMKCLTQLCKDDHLKSGDAIVVDGGIGGRFDHTMNNISQILFSPCQEAEWLEGVPEEYRNLFPGDAYKQIYSEVTVFLCGPESLCLAIHPGQTKLIVGRGKSFSRGCGLLPMVPVKYIKTTGLQYNLDGRMPLHPLGLVSACNQIQTTEDESSLGENQGENTRQTEKTSAQKNSPWSVEICTDRPVVWYHHSR